MRLPVAVSVFGLVMLLGTVAPTPATVLAGRVRPDVIVIVTDDVPAMDDRIWRFLPTIHDLFVRHGVNFTNFAGESPLCCPGRAGFLTGQHTFNHGVTHNDVRLFDPTMTLATALQGVGYRTFLAGKYFNLYRLIAPRMPPGWDGFHGYSGGYYNYTMWNNGKPEGEVHGTSARDYSTHVIAAKALTELRRTPPGQRVFGWIAPYGAHSPNTPASRYLHDRRCNAVPAWHPPNYNEKDVSDKPRYVRQKPLLRAPAYDLTNTCRTLLAVDDLVGDVRDELARQGRLDNTLFVLTTDNGMNAGAHRLLGKGTPYSTALPFYVSWPDGIGSVPRKVHEPLVNIDVAPTVCALARCTLGPYPNGQTSPDGRSFASILLGKVQTLGRDAILQDLPEWVSQAPPWYGVVTTSSSGLSFFGCAGARRGRCRWHYVAYSTGERELYDISGGTCRRWRHGDAGDPCELTNLAYDPAYAVIRSALARRLKELKHERGSG
jgi:N-acetylglucosamine-6-sulfatase